MFARRPNSLGASLSLFPRDPTDYPVNLLPLLFPLPKSLPCLYLPAAPNDPFGDQSPRHPDPRRHHLHHASHFLPLTTPCLACGTQYPQIVTLFLPHRQYGTCCPKVFVPAASAPSCFSNHLPYPAPPSFHTSSPSSLIFPSRITSRLSFRTPLSSPSDCHTHTHTPTGTVTRAHTSNVVAD